MAEQKGFDLTTHKFDGHGKLVAKNPYRLHVISGVRYFERPVNSANLWHENGEPAGRMIYEFDKGGKRSKRVDVDAKHIAYVEPLTGAAKLEAELAAARAELEAIKAERKGQTKTETQKG